ncbi:Erp family outer-surface lipoprotein (plasmid) [Borreliella andersonii]|uniref:Erp family outer-surface lipoprotein n=2 Tax=Borrelia andersonii TaxID=42109 RepID=A0ACD5G783_BORAD
MNKTIKMFIICAVFTTISSCKNDARDKDLKKQIKRFLDTKKEELFGGLEKLEVEVQPKDEELMQADEQSNGKIKFSKFKVNIKNKDNKSNWTDLGTLVVEKVEYGIATGLNNDKQGGGHSSTFFSLEEEEVNNFVKAMTEGGSFKTSLYYGYKYEQSDEKGIQNKEIITKIEDINCSKHITFSGDKIAKNEEDDKDRIAEYAISLEELKENLK